MTKSTITRDQLRALAVKKVESLKFAITQSAFTNIRRGLEEELQLAEFALAAMNGEPVILYRERNPYNGLTTGWQELTENEFSFIKENAGANAEFLTLYRHAQPAPVVPEEMTPEMMRAVQLNSELGAYAASNLSGAYDLFAEFWKVACRAAMINGGKP
ncbi:Uncharacterised protein [Klebsiella pneumoniae]|nr:Uncharacterised protein [Klebsiella pneumoniae]